MIRSPYMEISCSYDEFVAGWSSKRRSEHRRLRRKLEERGAVTLETATAGADATRLYGELLELEAQGWKAARGTAIAQQAQTRAHCCRAGPLGRRAGLAAARRAAARRARRRGRDRPGGACVFDGIKMGADPELRKVSPAVLLLDELVRRCCDLGLRRFEMLGSDDDYKRQWCDGVHERTAAARLRTVAARPSRPRRAGVGATARAAAAERRQRARREVEGAQAMSGIRPFEPADVPAAVALFERMQQSGSSLAGLEAMYRALLFEDPWADPELPSLVYEDENGELAGYITRCTRRFRFDAEPVRLSTTIHFFVDPAVGRRPSARC